MFERYTETARRTIFFARYEASQFGSPYIETEHLLLGLLREDKALANRFLRSTASVDSIREQIERRTTLGEKVSTSVDLPLSHDCKRVLAYGAEEAQRLNHKHIGTEHLWLGLLREKECFAAQLLDQQGLSVESVREQLRKQAPESGSPAAGGPSAFFARLEQWLAGQEARGGVSAARQQPVANKTALIAIYPFDPSKESEKGEGAAPAGRLAEIQKGIDLVAELMERAVASHEFEKARFYSEEERKQRESLRLLRKQYNLEEPPPRVPLLCIEIVRDERFSEIQERCDHFIAAGVAEVWLLDPELKRAYTVTKSRGLREFKGGVLRLTDPPLELDLSMIFR